MEFIIYGIRPRIKDIRGSNVEEDEEGMNKAEPKSWISKDLAETYFKIVQGMKDRVIRTNIQ